MAIYLRDFETHDEFISAYTGGEYVEPWVSYVEETKDVAFNKTQLLKIEIVGLTMKNDVPATGKTVDKDDCEYTVLAFYDDYTEKDITDEAVVTGSLVVEESELTERHSAGTLTLTAEYSGFNDSDSVTVWQEAATVSYLTFNITSDGDISWGCGGESAATIEYKKNDGEWTEITASLLDPETMSGGTKINVVAGDKVQFRGNNATYADPNEGIPYGAFAASTAGFTLGGNIMSLIDSVNYNEITEMTNDNAGAFTSLFSMCTGLTSAENLELPATTLASYCYCQMFAGCASLTTAPVLPATTLAEGCYDSMFNGCTSLTTAPSILPATTLAEGCYNGMFAGCTSLTSVPELPATALTSNCYSSMFNDCTSLTSAPALPATTLAEWCYSNMFNGCTSLRTAPALPASILEKNCYYSMFSGCTSLTTAPELPATTLTVGCYNSMFAGCTLLNYIKCLATKISAIGCTRQWVNGVASTGIFVKDVNMSSWTRGTNGIPNGWTVQDDPNIPAVA